MKRNDLKSTSSLAEFRVEHPMAHELPYWDLVGDIVVLSDGSMVKALRLKGRAIETLDTDSINQLNQDVRSFINSLPDNTELSFVVDVNSDCKEVIDRHLGFAKQGTEIGWVAESRGVGLQKSLQNLELVKTDLYLFLFLRPEAVENKEQPGFFKRFFQTATQFQSITRGTFEKRIHTLEQTRLALVQSLAVTGVECDDLTESAVRELIYRFLNPRRSRELSAPVISQAHREQEFSPDELKIAPELSLPSPREQFACSDLLIDYDSFVLDGVYHRVLTLKTLPELTHSAIIVKLLNLPFHYVLHCHIKVPLQSKELSQLQSKRRMAHSMSMSHGGRATDLESEAQLNATEELLREIINTGQKILYTQIAILLRAEDRDELELKTRAVLSKFRELNGAEGIVESVASLPAWKTILPCGTTTLLRPKRIKTDNLSDFLPIYQDFSGDGIQPICLFSNRSGGIVAYDPFDSRLPNYNCLVTGSSGAGKSFLNNLVLLQYMTQKPMVYIIDIGGSYKKLCEFLGGQYVEISPPKDEGPVASINPMLLPDGEKVPSPQKLKFLLAMLENMLAEENNAKLPKLERSLLEETLIRVYEKCSGVPTLSDLARTLSESPEKELKSFAKILFPWTGNRPYGRLLDQARGLNLSSDVVVFDLKGLSAYPDLQSVMILIITDFILGKIEAKGANQGRRKQILMDECWELLKSQASSSFMEYCVRTLRKTGSGITFITQSLDEIVASPIGGAILANTASKFILLQRGDLEPVRKIMKLNEQEMSLIGSLRQQKGTFSEAFLIYNEHRTVIRAVPSPVEYWLATSDASDNAKIEEARLQYPEKTLREIIADFAERFPYGYAQSQK
jgi:type IV secretory pathway VirB4 component